MNPEQAPPVDKADVVVGIVPPSVDAGQVEQGIRRLLAAQIPASTVVVHPPCGPVGCEPAQSGTDWHFLTEPRLRQDRTALAQSFGQSFRAVFDIAISLGARACAVITSDLSTVTASWIELLVNPVLENGFDLVAPIYGRQAFDGIVNRAMVYPMVRALYGKRVRNPMGPDFGLSERLLTRMAAGVRPRLHPLVSLVPEALSSGLKVCQARVNERVIPVPDWNNLTPIVSQVVTALFLDVERFAPYWQRARGSEPIPEFGTASQTDSPGPTVDPQRLMQSFQSSAHALIQVWGSVLPPSTLVELGALARKPESAFRMNDELWARIVYDFAVAHKWRPAERDRMLRAFTPIYMAWVASYVLQVASAQPGAVEERISELCACFEAAKPYFLSRWRWPDRFNP